MDKNNPKEINTASNATDSLTAALNEIENFFNTKIPSHIKNGLNEHHFFKKVDQKQIMQAIDFTPPFLRIEKIAIFNKNRDSVMSPEL